ncbi:MAG TPA: lysylphosphatidylglycerol synthase transmembrane domain-containing protein [Kofleriaceae bacterium]|nr:lysylphosphatidylglycerol synthase transmembrane domain-containing protein [Kofleriaceae bacterium]
MSRPAWARWVTRISLVVGVIALIVTIHKVGVRALAHYLRHIGWWWFAVVALEIVVTTLDAIAIRAFMSPDKIRLRSALLAQLAGRSVNAVTPSGNVGEAVKVSVLTEHVSQSRAVATILLYNIVSFIAELGTVAIAAPAVALLLPMPRDLRWLLLIVGAVCFVVSVAIYALVRRGMLASVAKVAVKLRLLSGPRYRRWQARLRSVDDKLRLVSGARTRDRWLGIGAIVVSRLTSLTLSLVILHAIGGPLTVGFVSGYVTGGFVVYMVATLVPMGLGVSEGGTYELFKALGENPSFGTALALARRTTLVVYAAVGLVLVTLSETVQRARDRQPEPVHEAIPLPTPQVAADVAD